MSVEISRTEFDQAVSDFVSAAGAAGEAWRAAGRADCQWLELRTRVVNRESGHSLVGAGPDSEDESSVAVVETGEVATEYQVHYSPSYQVPVLYWRATLGTGELLGPEEACRAVGGDWAGLGDRLDRLSLAPHPLTGLPWLQLHPCRTAELGRLVRPGPGPHCNLLATFLSLYGPAVGLRLPATLAMASLSQLS